MVTEPAPKILVIINMTVTRYGCRSVLGTAGYDVHEAESAEEGLARLRESAVPYDLIITDLYLPNKSGFDLLHELKEEPAYSRVPVMVLTGESRFSQVQEAIRLGAADYLQKPFSNAELLRRVQRLVGDSGERPSPGQTPLEQVLALEIQRAQRGQLELSLVVALAPGPPQMGPGLERLQEQVQNHLRVIDTVEILGSVGLAAVLPLTDRGGAEVVARKVAARLPESWIFGVASYPSDGTEPEQLVAAARRGAVPVHLRQGPGGWGSESGS